MTLFTREHLGPALLLELIPLITADWNEVNADKDIPFNLDLKTFIECEKLGVLRIFTARRDSELLGYSIFFVRHGVFCRDVLVASHVALFFKPEDRGSLPVRFVEWCDEQLRAEGVRMVSQNSLVGHSMERVLKHLGYVPRETVFVRDLNIASRKIQESV